MCWPTRGHPRCASPISCSGRVGATATPQHCDRTRWRLHQPRRCTMRIVVTAVAATALLGAVSVAFAADATGKIKNVDMNKDMIKLDNGSSYIVPKSVKLSDFKKVTVMCNKTGDKFDVTSIKPAV